MLLKAKCSFALALVLPGVAAAQNAPSSPAPATSANAYVAKAGASDLYEKTSSEIVLQSTKDARVKKFASMMLKDHTKSTNDVKTAASTDRVAVPAPALQPEQAQMIAKLRMASGVARDKLYVVQQRTAHEQALVLHSSYGQNGDKAALKQVAAATAPVVQHHLEMLRAM